VPIATAKVTLPEGVTLVRAEPSRLKLRLDPAIEEKASKQ